MPWIHFALSGTCAHCWERVSVGDPAYQGRHPKPFCVACAKRVLALEPPADLAPFVPVPTPVVETTIASEFSRFNRKGVTGRVKQAILDTRQRQSGEREDDETGV